MAGDEAGDVAKALAAFGAPSIRYHSFGQAPIRPSSVVRPARQMVMPPIQAPAPSVVLPQQEPVAAPEPRFDSAPAPAEQRRLASAYAAPPRPLAEWAPPLAAPVTPPQPAVAAAPVQPAALFAAPSPRSASPLVAAPPLVAASPEVARSLPNLGSVPRPTPVKRVPVPAPRSHQVSPQPERSLPARSMPEQSLPGQSLPELSLAELFAWLAGAPAPGEKPKLPDMFSRR